MTVCVVYLIFYLPTEQKLVAESSVRIVKLSFSSWPASILVSEETGHDSSQRPCRSHDLTGVTENENKKQTFERENKDISKSKLLVLFMTVIALFTIMPQGNTIAPVQCLNGLW